MSSKHKLLGIGIILILIVLLAMIILIVPKVEIEINGDSNINVSVGDNYIDKGAKAYLKKFTSKEELSIETKGNVDTNTPGKYIITYIVKYNNREINKIRVVNVSDKTAPTIVLNKPILMCKQNNLVEIDAKANDNLDGDISDNIKYKINNNKIIIYVTDSSNNKAEIVEDVNYRDSEKPTITLKGSSTEYIQIGNEYNESGANAYDSCDGNITNKIKIDGNVDVNNAGEYEITYEVEDSLNNKTIVQRKVIVVDNKVNGQGIIYLTFDDGPGQYTEEILDILNKYNIKATFFVTNQFPKYQYVIKKEKDNGHTVAIHTYSHKWSIYDSVDTYLNDFNKIQEIVIKETGEPAKYFRFPGGSSNTVSRSHSKGIMTKLAKLMQENGYRYFDWNIDSGDTHKKNTKEYIINMVKSHLKGNGEYVILMHDIKKNTLLALPSVIEYGIKNGYTFKAIDDSTPECHFKIAN